MLDSLRAMFETLGDQVWFFRFLVIFGVICIYRTLLNYVIRSNHCANPFCSKCSGSGTIRGRAINNIKNDNDDDNSLDSIILNNLLQHDRLCRKNDEKPTVYFHRGLSSNDITLVDQQILIDHYDELRQEIIKYFQKNDNIQWMNFYLYKNGKENKINCEILPKLFEILHLLPNAICINNQSCLFGNCFLTRLTLNDNNNNNNEEDKNKNGLTNCCIRMHFGLICDDQSFAYVLIKNQKRLPIENKRIISYNHALEHSIQNPNKKQQIFLTIDFWHPDLSSEMRKQLTSTFHTGLI
ncbi:unnamed protein product [Rotaria sordida]|uniref:Aspartyl/asparaginy/proline hydroxylase domain-containing protein n=1 Tax=Rotaria sordida TaxID=392033 RepID=A0A814RQ49_9BILA|nr:unnamed protein product [Rotaria sordida]CAF3584333.1 unnamed protein product [Rotaria sordida]